MSSSLLITSILLISHFSASSHAASLTHSVAIHLGAVQHQCTLDIGAYEFNLCPLISPGSNKEESREVISDLIDDRGEGSSTGRTYFEATRRRNAALARQRYTGSSHPCAEDDWVCVEDIDKETHAASVISLGQPLQVIATFNAEAEGTEEVPKSFRLLFEGEGESLPAAVDLHCARKQGELTYIGIDNQLRLFSWAGPFACPIKRSRPSYRIQADEGSDADPPSEENAGDDELLPNDRPKFARRWIAVVVVLISTSLAFAYLLSSSPRIRNFTIVHLATAYYATLPILSKAGETLQPIKQSIVSFTPKVVNRLASPFRQGDSQLVQWAQEDMGLTDAEDVMVNGGSGRYDLDVEGWSGNDLDEYIPLTIGPKHGRNRQVRSYGSTPEVETFEQRGIVGGLGKIFRR